MSAPRRYSFDHGPIHFLQFSTEHDFAPGSEQFAFILADLQSLNRSATPWAVAGFHRPFYTDSVYGNSDAGDVGFTDDIRNALERLFFQYQARKHACLCRQPLCRNACSPLARMWARHTHMPFQPLLPTAGGCARPGKVLP